MRNSRGLYLVLVSRIFYTVRGSLAVPQFILFHSIIRTLSHKVFEDG